MKTRSLLQTIYPQTWSRASAGLFWLHEEREVTPDVLVHNSLAKNFWALLNNGLSSCKENVSLCIFDLALQTPVLDLLSLAGVKCDSSMGMSCMARDRAWLCRICSTWSQNPCTHFKPLPWVQFFTHPSQTLHKVKFAQGKHRQKESSPSLLVHTSYQQLC